MRPTECKKEERELKGIRNGIEKMTKDREGRAKGRQSTRSRGGRER